MSPSNLEGKSAVSSDALALPIFRRLANKRIVLASASLRRKDILQTLGLCPEIHPSKFEENLRHEDFAPRLQDYAVATATEKAVEVYQRLVAESPKQPPELVIGADTIILLNDLILEKPETKPANLRMLLELNDTIHLVVTAVTIIYPQIAHPGFAVKSLCEETRVKFADNPTSLLEAYVNSGEGLDRAGGYAIQGKGAILVQSIEGDYSNVVGFPGFAFIRFLSDLLENDELFEDDEIE